VNAVFLAYPALNDLVEFPAGVLRKRGYHIFEARGRLLLNDWAAECAMPGWTDLPSAGDLLEPLATTGGTVRKLVAAVLSAIPRQDDRSIIERRLGLPEGTPQTLEAIAADVGVSRERIRQRQERALKTAASGAGAARPRVGYAVLWERARARLSEFVGDGTEENLTLAIAALSFPTVQPGYTARVITVIAGGHGRRQAS
jgi:Sigma-70, region 4